VLFCQFPLRKADEFGLGHTFDFHWKISTQSAFADLLVFDEISIIRGLRHWSDRLRLLREVTLPGPTYVLKADGLLPSSLATALLPILYLHRLASGSWKVLAGQK
jgi:hypothetical protein